jgi:glutamate-1-semialdehyde 2,1-aminomutase
VLDKLVREPVIRTLRARGGELMAGVANRIDQANADGFLSVSGDPSWSFLNFAAPEGIDPHALKTLWLQEMFARGVLTLGTHNMSYAHGEADVAELLGVYGEVFPLLAEAVRQGDVERRLRCAPLQPLFKVR